VQPTRDVLHSKGKCYIPANEVITVYSAQGDFDSFGSKDTEVIDEILDIRLPKPKIFGKGKHGS